MYVAGKRGTNIVRSESFIQEFFAPFTTMLSLQRAPPQAAPQASVPSDAPPPYSTRPTNLMD